MSAKKGRPKKMDSAPVNRQTSDSLGWLPSWGAETRKENFKHLLLDPKGHKLGADIFGPLLLGDASDEARTAAGAYLCHVIEHGSIQAIDETFRDLKKLKERADEIKGGGEIPRPAQAYYAYSAFIDETGREPSKKELRIYICERERYTGFPPKDATDQWSQVWEDSGLKHLQNG